MDKEKLLKIAEFLEEMGYTLTGHMADGDELRINAKKTPKEEGMENREPVNKGKISELVEVLENNGYSILGAGYKNDDYREPITVTVKKFMNGDKPYIPY
jgi:hypothetical protein